MKLIFETEKSIKSIVNSFKLGYPSFIKIDGEKMYLTKAVIVDFETLKEKNTDEIVCTHGYNILTGELEEI